MDGLVKNVVRLLIIIFLTSQVVNSSLPHGNYSMSCHRFHENQLIYVTHKSDFIEAPDTCIFQNVSNTVDDFDCIYTHDDEKCGPGFRLVTLNRSTCNGHGNGLMACCTSCERCVIRADSSDCNSECCQWGRMPTGSRYTKQVGRNVCMFSAGRWGQCDNDVLKRFRNDTLVNRSYTSACPTVHRMSKICRSEELDATPLPPVTEDPKVTIEKLRALGCRYDEAELSSCSINKTRTLSRRKTKGPEECPEVLEDERPCYTIRCVYGKWSRWTACEQNVQIRERKVLIPDAPHCDKTHKARICDFGSSTNKRRRRKYRQSPNS